MKDRGKINFLNLLAKLVNMPKIFVLFLIRVYQYFFSFDHSFWGKKLNYRVCIHTPSCSQYTYDAISKFGLIQGLILGLIRIIKCNPFNSGGYDPVPDKSLLQHLKAVLNTKIKR